MKIPSSLYGRNKDVKANARKMVTALKKGQSLAEAVGADNVLETATREGLIMMDASPTGAYVDVFHCYLPFRTIYVVLGEQLSAKMKDNMFQEGLETSWGVLSILGPNNFPWLSNPKRHRSFLDAALKFWDEMNSVGERYSMGGNAGTELWNVPNNIHYVLANMGVPQVVLNSPLPVGGLPEIAATICKQS